MTAKVFTQHAETALFGAGCFWGVEDYFSKVDGILETEVGYAGGHTKNPTYADVCTDTTGHAEVVRVTFDSSRVSYKDLLNHFFKVHDPTTPNRSGPDVGSQYRSIILFTTPTQEKEAKEKICELSESGLYTKSIVTEIAPAKEFYRAEEYHQKYVEKTGRGACHIQP